MTPSDQNSRSSITQRATRIISGLGVVVGVTVICGWVFDLEILRNGFPGTAPMKPTAAVAFLLLSLALGFAARESTATAGRLSQLFAVTAGLIGWWSLGTYYWSGDLHLNHGRPLAETALGPGPPRSILLPINTAFGMVLLSLSISLLSLNSGRGTRLAQGLALTGALFGFIPLLGHFYGFQALFHFDDFFPISPTTALLFTVIGVGAFCARPHIGLVAVIAGLNPGASMIRRSLPAILLVPFFMGWLTLKGQKAGWFEPELGLSLLIVANVLFFFMLIWANARALNRAESERQRLRESEHTAQAEINAIKAQNDRTLETLSDALMGVDSDWRIVYINTVAAKFIGRAEAEILGQTIWTVFPNLEASFRPDLERAIATQEPNDVEAYFAPMGRWMEIRLSPAPDRLSLVFHDISARKRAEAMTNSQRQVLEMVARGESLSSTLDALLRFLEDQSPDIICSILLLDADGQHVRHASSPSLPVEYSQTIDGAPIGPNHGSCGTALFRGEPVLVADIAHDPLWQDYKHLVIPLGLKACWSHPIFDPDGKTLGTFATYHREIGLPTSQHQELIDLATQISAICINREKAELALRTSEARYARAVRGTSDGIWDWDIRTNEEYLSPRWKEVLGFKDHELPSHIDTFRRLLHPDDLGPVNAAVEAHLQTRQPYDMEIRLLTKAGQYRWFRTRGQAEWDEHGRPIRMAGSNSDIHARKEAQLALEQEKAQASSVLNSLRDHIAVIGPDGVVIAVNAAWVRFAEENNAANSPSVLPGCNYLETVAKAAETDSTARSVHAGIVAVLEGHRDQFEIEYPCNSPTLVRRFLMVVTGLRHGRGAVISHDDITARTIAQEKFRNAARFNQQIIESANEGIVVLDHRLHYTSWNSFMENLMGISADEVLGSHAAEKFPWFEKDGQLAALQQALNGEPLVLPDIQRLRTGSKSLVWLQARISPLRDVTGEIIGVIAMISDITERKRAEQQLSRSHARLRALAARLQSVREEQSAHIAREIHDVLGQQLTALKLDLIWLKRRMRGVTDEALQGKLIEKLFASIQLIDSTIVTVQKVATELRPGLLEKLGLIPALEEEVRAFTQRTGLKRQLELDAALGPIAPQQAINIFRICQELLTNIARHAHAKNISVSLIREASNLVLEVSDDGVGISRRQLTAAKSLGLLGMMERAQLLGGSLDISRAQGKGTTARLIIPTPPQL